MSAGAQQAPRSPVPRDIGVELERVVRRWHQLPLDHALSSSGRVRALAQSLADDVAEVTGIPATVLPDCGSATLMDQLTVVVYDASAAVVSGAFVSADRASATGAVAPGTVATGDGGNPVTRAKRDALISSLSRNLATLRRDLG